MYGIHKGWVYTHLLIACLLGNINMLPLLLYMDMEDAVSSVVAEVT